MNKWSYRVVFDWILTTYGRFAYVRRARDASAAAGACRTPAVLHGMVQWTAAGEYARTHARTHLPVWQQNRRANSACFKHAYLYLNVVRREYVHNARRVTRHWSMHNCLFSARKWQQVLMSRNVWTSSSTCRCDLHTQLSITAVTLPFYHATNKDVFFEFAAYLRMWQATKIIVCHDRCSRTCTAPSLCGHSQYVWFYLCDICVVVYFVR